MTNPDPDAQPYEYNLRFTTMTCDECGATGFAADGRCACGVVFEERDSHVDARRRIVVTAWSETSHGQTARQKDLPTQPPEGVWDELSGVMASLLVSFQAVALGENGADKDLATAMSSLAEASNRIRGSTWLRPWISSWRALDRVVAGIECVASNYLLALTAETATEAERLGIEAQLQLDELAVGAARFGNRVERWVEADNPSPDPIDSLPGMAAGAFHVAGATSMVDLDALGGDLYSRVTGSEDPPPGIGLQLQINGFLASVIFDEEAFWTKAATAFGYLSSKPTDLTLLIENGDWVAAMRASAAELRDITMEIGVVANAMPEDRFDVRNNLRLGGRLFEPISRPLMAALLAVTKGRDLNRLLRTDPNQAIRQTRDGLNPILVDGVLAALRDADAHRDYSTSGNTITFTSDRTEVDRLTYPELTDRVLAGLETVAAIQIGLVCALIHGGMDPEDADSLFGVRLSELDHAQLALGFSGWTSIDSRLDGEKLTIKGDGSFPENPFTLGGVVGSVAPPVIDSLCLTGNDGNQDHTLEGPLGLIRDWNRLDPGFDKDAEFLVIGREWLYDGNPIFSSDHVRKWVAMKASAVIRGPRATRTLKTLYRLAIRLGDEALAEALLAAIRIRRQQAMQLPVNPEDFESLALIVEWEKRTL